MIIKKYVVSDMKEAMVRAKYELGKDAMIISQRSVRPGRWFNPFRKKKLEVTLALEDEVHEKYKGARIALEKTYDNLKKKAQEENPADSLPLGEDGPKTEETQSFKPASVIKARAYRAYANRVVEESKTVEGVDPDLVFKNSPEVEEKWKGFCEDRQYESSRPSEEGLLEFIKETYPDNPFDPKVPFQKVQVLIGQTGVGKTTTIAKIASNEFLKNNQKVGLITIDTYRIAAVEQLKTYAGILGIPCETVNTPEEMKKKIMRLSYCDVILVDTVGASPKNVDRIEDVKKYVDQVADPKNVFLVMSMSIDQDTNNKTFEKYRTVDYNGLIVSKLDEVEHFANFWNVLEKAAVPVEYYCYGQNVPDDIGQASLQKVLSYLWGELQNE
ncbi:MAG TPA: flagellar biosynthesis protein FlhF [Eubacteriaceae bacterium]|nr:flagellar biosynthesis protein FlhF [Eubacteriaceae bacterium]